MGGLGAWLGGRTADQLADLLAARAEVMYPPPPDTLGELADRLSRGAGVRAALYRLDRPALQVVEACQVLGDGVSRTRLADFLDVPVSDGAFARALRQLADLALIWPDGSDRLRLARPLRRPESAPLLLGEPAETLLADLSVDKLRRIVGHHTLRPPRLKKELVAAAVTALDNHEAVRAMVTRAPDRVQELLTEMAWHGPVLATTDDVYLPTSYPSEIQWALDRGLLVEVTWATMTMPREVALAVRGPGYRAPFDPDPPAVDVSAGDPTAVAREAAAAAGRALGQVTALLEHIAGQPVALLRSGGVGVRELRRLATVVAADPAAVRLWLEVATAAGFLARGDGGVLVTAAYDDWRVAEPADQLVPLLTAWWALPAVPTGGDGREPVHAALTATTAGADVVPVRRELLGCVAALAPDRVTDPAAAVPQVEWRRPGSCGDLADPAHAMLATWREAETLGAAARGQVSDLGHALLTGDDADLATAVRGMLPAAASTAVFQADLTAVVWGAPSARLAALLDRAADRESRDSASTWRFSAASVRRALDAGETARELLGALSAAGTTALPQPLTYLVSDVARRHGAVRVTPVACCVRSDDPTLLAEIAAARGLKNLKLRILAPTVLASAKPVAETLRLLRGCGYAPVSETADGVPQLERIAQHRAGPSSRAARGSATRTAPPADLDPYAVAKRLVDTPTTVPEPAASGAATGTAGLVRAAAAGLPIGEARLLAHAIDHDHPVRIDYRNRDGRPSTRVVSGLSLDPPYLAAYCHLRDADRVFLLSRIDSVTPD